MTDFNERLNSRPFRSMVEEDLRKGIKGSFY